MTSNSTAATHLRRAVDCKAAGRFDEARIAYEEAVACQPDDPSAHLELANLLHDQGDYDGAISGYSRAIALKVDFADAYSNLGNVLRKKGEVEAAIAACRRAIAILPGFAQAHMNLSLALLLHGELTEGWQHYEWRWKGGSKDLIPRDLRRPRWQGEDLVGKTLLLHTEQGMGDTLQFARFAPLTAARAGRIMLAVQPPLVGLLSVAHWPNVTVNNGSELRGFDFEIPLMSLPAALGITAENIPADVPYLAADPRRVAAWRSRLPRDKFNIGLVWQGRPDQKIDPGRSFPLRSCAPLSELPGVRLISLQKHHGLEQLYDLPRGMQVDVLGADFDHGPDAFADTAALMLNLDLIVTVDTATAHLGGALARPTWIALKQVPDWRWGLHGEVSPWYPTARLFRQRTAGEWDDVFTRMAEELARTILSLRAR